MVVQRNASEEATAELLVGQRRVSLGISNDLPVLSSLIACREWESEKRLPLHPLLLGNRIQSSGASPPALSLCLRFSLPLSLSMSYANAVYRPFLCHLIRLLLLLLLLLLSLQLRQPTLREE